MSGYDVNRMIGRTVRTRLGLEVLRKGVRVEQLLIKSYSKRI